MGIELTPGTTEPPPDLLQVVGGDVHRLDDALVGQLGPVVGGPHHIRRRPLEEVREGEALLSVRDSGPGIDPEYVPHLFDRFYRANTRSSGLGLGLYISRILVEAHGGRI